MSTLTPAEIAQWYREQAQHFAQEAERLERAFNLKHVASKPAPDKSIASESTPVVDRIVNYLVAIGAKRPADIAIKLDIPKDIVEAAIDANPTRLVRAERGWIKPASQAQP